MARIKIDLPAEFQFTTLIPIRITDINYGGHVGNDTILSIIQEARMQLLNSYGYKELDVEGAGLIMSDAGIEFKSELFYGDIIIASVAVGEFSRIGFDIYYKLEKELNGQRKLVAGVKTGMICYDYDNKRIVNVPDAAKRKLTGS